MEAGKDAPAVVGDPLRVRLPQLAVGVDEGPSVRLTGHKSSGSTHERIPFPVLPAVGKAGKCAKCFTTTLYTQTAEMAVRSPHRLRQLDALVSDSSERVHGSGMIILIHSQEREAPQRSRRVVRLAGSLGDLPRPLRESKGPQGKTIGRYARREQRFAQIRWAAMRVDERNCISNEVVNNQTRPAR